MVKNNISSFSITGDNNFNNSINILGSQNDLLTHDDNDFIYKFKNNILSNILINYYRKNYKQLKNELLMKDTYIKTLQHFIDNNNQYYLELQPYIILLNNLEGYLNNIEKINFYENKFNLNDKNQTNITYFLPEIKINPEYELYDIIIGKPNFKLKQNYDINIINKIKKLLKNPNINFQLLQQKILK